MFADEFKQDPDRHSADVEEGLEDPEAGVGGYILRRVSVLFGRSLWQIPCDGHHRFTGASSRQVRCGGSLFFLENSNHLPIDSSEAGFDANNIVTAFYREPR